MVSSIAGTIFRCWSIGSMTNKREHLITESSINRENIYNSVLQLLQNSYLQKLNNCQKYEPEKVSLDWDEETHISSAGPISLPVTVTS